MPPFSRMTPAVFLVIASLAQAQEPAVSVRTAPVIKQTVQQHRRFTGSLRAISRAGIAALEDGRVVEVTVREGATLRAGDVIARVDDRRLQAQKAELEATHKTTEALIAQRQAEVVIARNDYERASNLAQSRTVSAQELEQREASLAVAEAQLAAERRRLDQIVSQLQHVQVRLDDTIVRSPFAGRVVERSAEPGEWIRAGEPFVTLVSSGTVEAWLELPERYAARLAEKELPWVEIEGLGTRVQALRVRRVPQIHPQTRTFSYVVELDDQQGDLVPGMSVTAWLPVGEEQEHLMVPRDAIVRSDRSAYVVKADRADRREYIAVRAPVEILFETGGDAVIRPGALEPGDQVVVEGNERTLPGMTLSVTPADPHPESDVKTAGHAR